jgi:hypothetical protein
MLRRNMTIQKQTTGYGAIAVIFRCKSLKTLEKFFVRHGGAARKRPGIYSTKLPR